MRKISVLILLAVLLGGCKNKTSSEAPEKEIINNPIKYAQGLKIESFDEYKTLTITNPWPGSDRSFKYALVDKGHEISNANDYDAIVEVPLTSIVVTSTTHIPSLEMLEVESSLKGFPSLNYISSEITRQRIKDGHIKEVGKNEDLNTEVLVDLDPQAIVTFAVQGNNTSIAKLEQTGIPVLYNSDWTETTPLGKAEWIKFFGVLFDKEKEADSIFSQIEDSYKEAKTIAAKATNHPTVLSGAMYKDIWYLPQGDSWAAQFIKDANASYLWNDTEGTGSASLNLETVLEKGKNAQFWIGPGQFTSLEDMKDAHPVYAQFDAYKSGNVFSFTTRKGETGGVIYYELAPNRPDLVLRDIIKILHPDLLPNHSTYFFSKID